MTIADLKSKYVEHIKTHLVERSVKHQDERLENHPRLSQNAAGAIADWAAGAGVPYTGTAPDSGHCWFEKG